MNFNVSITQYYSFTITLYFIKATKKDIISIDEESANEQRAKRIGANYQPYWIKQ